MKLRDAQKHMLDVTGKFSDVARQIMFAGVAIVWLFAAVGDVAPSASDLGWLAFPLTFFVVGIMADFMQYAVRAIGVRNHYERKNREFEAREQELAAVGKDYRDEYVEFPGWIRRWADRFFYGKVVCVVIAYASLPVTLVAS